MVDLEKALNFVQLSGDAVLTALATFAAGRAGTAQTLQTIRAYQREDGGWTKTDKDFQGDLSVISTTWVALQWLLWIGAGESEELQKTLAFLHTAQHAPGCWDEAQAIQAYDPPPWMLPGRYENQLWLTSAACCKLKELGCEGEVRFNQALDFLRAGWDGQP